MAPEMGSSLPAAALVGLRTAVITLAASICGSRFGRGWIIPGGVRFDLDLPLIEKARRTLGEVLTKFSDIEALFLNSSSALARMEEIGTVTVKHARAAGLVGLAPRASAMAGHARADYPYGIARHS